MIAYYRSVYPEGGLPEVRDEAGEVIANERPEKYTAFSNETIELDEHHKMTQGTIKVNTKACMDFLTDEMDPEVVAWDKVSPCQSSIVNAFLTAPSSHTRQFISEHYDLIEKLGAANPTVNLFALNEDRSIDKSTWGDVDYTPLVDGIWRQIGIHSHHQQRCENYVQLAALVGKTLVGEKRRTWRAIAVSVIVRQFNLHALQIRKEMLAADPVKQKKVKRVTGTLRIKLFDEWVHDFMQSVERAKEDLTREEYADIANTIASAENKVSKEERMTMLQGFKDSLEKPMKQLALEKESGYDPTYVMGGSVKISILTNKNNLGDQVNAELIARGIPSSSDFIKEHGNLPLEKIGINKRVNALKRHEAETVTQKKNPHMSMEKAMAVTKSIEPISQEMKEILLIQSMYLK